MSPSIIRPVWLPGFVAFDASAFPTMDAYYQYACNQFTSDWGAHPIPTFYGLPVLYNTNVLNWNLPEGFWHAVSQNSFNTGLRVPDILRCERILWVKAIIQAFQAGDPLIRHSIESKKDKRKRLVQRNHLFLDVPNNCHLVILEKSGNFYHLVSVFHIGEGSGKCNRYRSIPHVS